jgi:hypothetical protein
MKYVKMLGLAAVAMAALMAVFGASSASATVLCKTKPTESGTTGTTCPTGWAYPAGTKNHAVSVGGIALHTSGLTIECKSSTIEGEFENEGSATETVKGPVKTLTFEGCNCEVKVLKTGTQEVHWVPDTFNGTVTGNGAEITATCSTIFGTLHCIYVANNLDLGESTASTSPETAAILHVNVTVARSPTNALCEEEAKWTATYETTTPKPLWFAAHT